MNWQFFFHDNQYVILFAAVVMLIYSSIGLSIYKKCQAENNMKPFKTFMGVSVAVGSTGILAVVAYKAMLHYKRTQRPIVSLAKRFALAGVS